MKNLGTFHLTPLLLCFCLSLHCGNHSNVPLAASSSQAWAQENENAKEAKGLLPKEVASFDYVWNAIKRTHWDPQKVGAQWDTAYKELRPKILVAKNSTEAHTVLSSLIARIGQSHFNVTPQRESTTDSIGGSGVLGVEIRLIEASIVVWRIAAGSSAEKVGVRPGMIIQSVNGRSWKKVHQEWMTTKGSADEEARLAASFVHGPLGQKAKLILLDANNKERQKTIVWQKPPGTLASLGFLKDISVDYQAHEIGKDIGYIRLNVFLNPAEINQKFKSDIKKFGDKKGVILDLRGNPGGLGFMSIGLAGHLVGKTGKKLGTMISKDARLDFVVNPQPSSFEGTLVLIVDGQCASTCEILAAGLSQIGRAHVVGTKTAGAALPSVIESLPNGSLFQYATANYISTNGKELEHDGFTPTNIVPLTRESLLNGSDSQLAAAISWIQKN